MIQDYLYLLDYTKVFSIGTAKAKNLDAMRLFAGYTIRSWTVRWISTART